MKTSSKLILASSSPRRLDLLKNIGFEPASVVATDIDESQKKNEKPIEYVERIAKEKAKVAVVKCRQDEHSFILTADTTVALGTRIIGKPEDAKDAERIIRLLSGRKHRVYTCVVVVSPKGETRSKTVLSTVKFKKISEPDLAEYIKTKDWEGKAGAYSLQKDPAAMVISISGSFSNIIGLPLYETKNLLLGMGFRK
jgi:septum formation protein